MFVAIRSDTQGLDRTPNVCQGRLSQRQHFVVVFLDEKLEIVFAQSARSLSSHQKVMLTFFSRRRPSLSRFSVNLEEMS
jgi:hypothetical protein